MEKKEIKLNFDINTESAKLNLNELKILLGSLKEQVEKHDLTSSIFTSLAKKIAEVNLHIKTQERLLEDLVAQYQTVGKVSLLSDSMTDLKRATSDLKEIMESQDIGSEEFTKAAILAGEYNKKIEQTDNLIKLLGSTTPSLDILVSTTENIEAGFTGAKSAAEFFGLETSKLSKIIDKVSQAQAAFSSIQKVTNNLATSGAQTLQKGGKEGTQLAGSINGATGSFKILNKVMSANVIGVIITAVATLAAYWDDIKEAINGVSSEQKEANKNSAAIYETEKKTLKNFEVRENIERLSGRNEKEILKLKNGQLDVIIAAGEADLKNQEITLAAQIEAEKRNKAILKGILEFVSVGITPILHLIDLAGKAFGEDWGLVDKFTDFAASQLFDPKETEKKGQETIEAAKASLEELRNQKAGNELRIKEIDNENYQKWKDNFKKRTEEELTLAGLKNELTQKKELDALEKLHKYKIIAENEYEIKKQEIINKWAEIAKQKEQERNEAITEANRDFLTEEAKDFEERLKDQNLYYDKQKLKKDKEFAEGRITENDYNKAVLKIETDRLNTVNEVYQNHQKSILENLKASVEAQKTVVTEQKEQGLITEEEYGAAIAYIDKEYNSVRTELIQQHNNENLDLQKQLGENEIENIKAVNEEKKRIEELIYKSRIDIAQNASNILGSLSELLIKQGKEQTDVQKALALVQLGIDTAVAISNTLRNTTAPSVDNQLTGGVAGVVKYVAISAQILSAAARAKNILSSGGSGSGASVSAPSPSVSAPKISAPQLGGTQILSRQHSPEPLKVFVTEADIRKAQQKVKVIEGQSVVV